MDANENTGVKIFGIRHGQVLLHFTFYVVLYGIQLSLSFTINPIIRELESHLTGSAYLSVSVISTTVSCYFYGFLVTLLFSGWICKKFGYKLPMVIMMTVISLITIFIPTIIKLGEYRGLIVCRTIQGLCGGVVFSMPAEFINRWLPASEKTFYGTVIYSAPRLGEALIVILSFYFTTSNLGWSFVYTVYGSISIIWVLAMIIFGAESPEDYQKGISEDELNNIVDNRGNVKTDSKQKIPWCKMFSSKAFWAIIIAEIGNTWLLYVVSSLLPIFCHEHMQAMYTDSSSISWICSFFIAGLAQYLINRNKTSQEQSRKIFNSVGSCISAVLIVSCIFLLEEGGYGGIVIASLITVASVGMICGSKLNSNDITPNFAPIVYGLATWFGIFSSGILGLILQDHIFDNWKFLFIFTACFVLITNFIFLVYGKGEDQEWEGTHEEISDQEIGLSNSTTKLSLDEKKYLLYVRKQ